MKKTAALLASLMLFAGCAQDNRPVDERYIESLKKTLETRWEAETLGPELAYGGFPVDAEKFKTSIDEEIKELEPYASETFENEELQKAAETYLDSLQDLKESTKYLSVDANRFYHQYEDIKDDEAITLSQINSIEPIEFETEENQVRMDMILEEAKITEQMNDLAASIKFETVEEEDIDGYYFAKLQATVDNTSEFTIDDMMIDFNFVTEDGTVVDEDYVDIPEWKPGQSQTLTITSSEKYSRIEISRVYCTIMDYNYYDNVNLYKLNQQ